MIHEHECGQGAVVIYSTTIVHISQGHWVDVLNDEEEHRHTKTHVLLTHLVRLGSSAGVVLAWFHGPYEYRRASGHLRPWVT